MVSEYRKILQVSAGILILALPLNAQRQMEFLDRGMEVQRISNEEVFVSWRLLTTDPDNVAFNLYRTTDGYNITRLNDSPVVNSTNWVDCPEDFSTDYYYYVRPFTTYRTYPGTGSALLPANAEITLNGLDQAYKSFPIESDIESVDRIGVGDLDGDGDYDFLVKHPAQVADPGKFVKPEDTYKFDAYTNDGEFLWRRDLGWNIVLGIWWSPMIVYDLDGDGRAEVVSKTAPVDIDYRNEEGRVLTGPEYFSIFDGLTGEELDRKDWISRGEISDWGDSYGNRVNRNLMCVAYLDGVRPSVIIFRGTYGLMKAEAWNFRDGALSKVWSWSNEELGTEYQAQGFHNIRVADIDEDGKDEIINGAIVIDDDGSTLYTTGQGHGDRFVVSDIDPSRNGLESWYVQESPERYDFPIHLTDTQTGEMIFGKGNDSWGDVGRGLAADIDPRYWGQELWSNTGGLYSASGTEIYPEGPRYANTFVCEFGLWWDEDLLRELTQFGRLLKFDYATGGTERIGTSSRDNYCIADILGDWREEIVCFVNGELQIFIPTDFTSHRMANFMHDPIYRLDVATMTMGYRQSANTSFYIGFGMGEQPLYNPDIIGIRDTALTHGPFRYDFSPGLDNPLKQGFDSAIPLTKYGWLDTHELSGVDQITTNDLLRDFITSEKATLFQVPLKNGRYRVKGYSGDAMEANQTYILADGTLSLELICEAGEYAVDSFETTIQNGILDLTFYGNPWKINGLEIICLDQPTSKNNYTLKKPVSVIYFDPSVKTLHLRSEESCNQLSIYHSEGREVYRTTGRQANSETNLTHLSAGVYIVLAEYGTGVAIQKIVITE